MFFWYNIHMKTILYAATYFISGCIIVFHALLLQFVVQCIGFDIRFIPAFVAMLIINLGISWVKKPDPRVREFKDFLDKWF